VKWSSSRGAAMVGRALVHGGHVLATRRPLRLFDELVAGIEVSKVDADSGLFPAKFGHGPLSKVVNLGLLYNFRLRRMVIRITD